MIVSNPLKQNTGPRERGSCWNLIAVTLNAIEKPAFKVNQRAIRDLFNKILNAYKRTKSYEETASGIAPEQTELDILLEGVSALKNEGELINKQESEKKTKQVEEELLYAQAVHKMGFEGGVKPRNKKT